MRLLVVEDDVNLARSIAKFLTYQNYVVDTAPDGQMGWEFTQCYVYDLVILDVMLPKLGGIDLCQKLRQAGCDTPILLLTACGSNHNKIAGLEAGADDYVTKPFDWQELQARIRALLRRKSDLVPSLLTWGALSLNSSTCEVSYGEAKLPLRPKEYKLLELFLRSPNRIFSCSAILEHLWSFEDLPSPDAVRAHIKGLRQKLKAVGAEAMVETVYGLGYRLKPMADRPQTPGLVASGLPLLPEIKNELEQALAIAWEEVKPGILEQVNLLELTIEAMSGQGQEKLRQTAIAQAHKLAGTVGSYGFTNGSQQANQIETYLQNYRTFNTDQIAQLQKQVTHLHQVISGPGANPPTLSPTEGERFWQYFIERDPLTHLANRVKFTQDFEQFLEMAQRHHQPLALVLLRIKQLKSINYQYGYACGDRVLYAVGNVLKAMGGYGKAFGRWSGQTFAIALYGFGTEATQIYREQLLQRLKTLEILTSTGSPLTVNFQTAIAQYPDHGQSIQTLYQFVEQAQERVCKPFSTEKSTSKIPLNSDLTDAQWQQLAPLLPPEKPKTGRTAHSHRATINGILWILRTGSPWRNLPPRYGKHSTVSSRFYRWRQAGIWDKIWSVLH